MTGEIDKRDPWYRLSITSVLLLCVAAPVWLYVMVIVSQSKSGPGAFFTLVILTAMTVAIHRLFRYWSNSWGLSALLAGITGIGSLYGAFWFLSH